MADKTTPQENQQPERTNNLEEKYKLYLQVLDTNYRSLNEVKRKRFVGNLETFIGRWLIGEVLPVNLDHLTIAEKIGIDGEELNNGKLNSKLAKAIRERVLISSVNLSEGLGLQDCDVTNYENGFAPNKRLTDNFRRYLLWLKEVSGYNPFNL